MKALPKQVYAGGPAKLLFDGECAYPWFPGRLLHVLAKLYRPKADDLRMMLLELRKRFHWSQAYLASVLGVPQVTLRHWESGERTPSGPAGKVIWLVHALLLRPASVRNHRDIAFWGSANCAIVLEDRVAELEKAARHEPSPDGAEPVPHGS